MKAYALGEYILAFNITASLKTEGGAEKAMDFGDKLNWIGSCREA